MKYSLFWKIFIGFFITFFAIIIGLWLVFTFYGPELLLGAPPPGVPPHDLHANRPAPHLPVPIHLLLLGMVGGLVFSGGLAWYMVQPIRRLRWGFAQLAEGNLEVRLQKIMGKRHDEIADLARDFDHMAAQMEYFVNSRRQLLHDVSHELRSPLARLNIALALLQQDPSRIPEIIKRIKTETQHLDNMTDELLTLFQAESGGPQLDSYIDLKSLVYTIVQDAEFEASASEIEIKTNVTSINESAEVSHILKGNAQLLRRAIENVVRNAIRHADKGKHIEVNLYSKEKEQCYYIIINDQGPGVPAEKLRYLFEPFIRVHPNTQTDGFGLGLAIAQRAVLIHQGTIKAENRQMIGLTVTIKLPFNTSYTTL